MVMRKGLNVIVLMVLTILLSACSTKKNTSGTRFFHSMTARFNTMYNGNVAYNDGIQAQEKGHQDDYTHLLPMSIQTNPSTAKLGSSNYETAITKCEKAIKLHSIKKRPQVKSGKKKTAKQKEYLQRKEYNPYLKNSWLLMGKALYARGEFIEAASTFNYITKLYSTQPEVYSVAKAWLSRCYVALEWPYDAEDVLNKMRHDTVSVKGAHERDATLAAYYIQTHQYDAAIPPLKNTVKYTSHKLQRSRLKYLIAQLYSELEDDNNAYKYYSKVIRSNPPYELAFNARIAQTEVASKGQAKKMIKKLQRMAKSDKNKDYLDQVYYAIGNIYLSEGDTLRCTWSYEKGAEKSTRNGIAKAVLLLRLSQLYWETEQYIDAQRTYKECVSILSGEHKEYPEAERRSKILDEAEPHLSAVKLQDSLQALAKLPEKEYLAAIDRVIDALKKKEKEEAKNEALASTMAATAAAKNQQMAANNATNNASKGAWYFYNPSTTASGKQEFQRKWGKRSNEDLWRLASKPASFDDTMSEYDSEENNDTIDNTIDDNALEEQARLDSLQNDPHNREYYLVQIPFTEEQMELSNQLLSDGLYNGGIIAMEKIQNFPYAERLLQRLLRDFPDYDPTSIADIYYHLFLLYGRIEDDAQSERYRQLLIEAFPDDKRAILLANPNYEMIARNGKHIEDSIYAATYEAYQADRYSEVARNYEYHTQNFPEGKHRARIMFIQAMSLLYTHQRTEFLSLLQELIQTYGKEEIAEMASYIVKGVQEGRLLSDSKYDSSDIWKRRRYNTAEGDSIAEDTLSASRYSTFNFVLAYPRNSLDEDQLLYEMANYNFTSYMIRNFEIEILDADQISMMCIKGFLSYDEVHAYAQRLYGDPHMAAILEGIRSLLISEENLQLIGIAFSFDEYKDFYDEEFAPLQIPEDLQIDEPTDMEIRNYDDEPEGDEEGEEYEEEEDDFPYGF